MQRALESALRLAGVPYQIVGGVEFYARREIRDLKSEYTTLSAELNFGTRQSEIAGRVDTLGLKPLKLAPYKLAKDGK